MTMDLVTAFRTAVPGGFDSEAPPRDREAAWKALDGAMRERMGALIRAIMNSAEETDPRCADPEEECEDVIQLVLVKLFRRGPGAFPDTEAAVRAYLWTSMLNMLETRRRQGKNRAKLWRPLKRASAEPATLDLDAFASDAPPPGDQAMAREFTDLIASLRERMLESLQGDAASLWVARIFDEIQGRDPGPTVADLVASETSPGAPPDVRTRARNRLYKQKERARYKVVEFVEVEAETGRIPTEIRIVIDRIIDGMRRKRQEDASCDGQSGEAGGVHPGGGQERNQPPPMTLEARLD